MSEPIYTQEQMLRIRNENFAAGIEDERDRIIKLLEEHRWFEKGEQDEILGILDGSYKCECEGCIPLIKEEQE